MAPAEAFRILNLPSSASPDEVRSAFRNLAKVCHPDTGGTAEAFRELKEAQEVALVEAARPKHQTYRAGRVVWNNSSTGVSFEVRFTNGEVELDHPENATTFRPRHRKPHHDASAPRQGTPTRE